MRKIISMLITLSLAISCCTVFAQDDADMKQDSALNPIVSSELVISEEVSDEPSDLATELEEDKAPISGKPDPFAQQNTISIKKFAEKASKAASEGSPKGIGNNDPNNAWFIDPSIYDKYIGDTIAGTGLSSWYYLVQNDPLS